MEEDWEVLEFDVIGVEWNHEKAQINKRKHGVSFDEAIRIFGSKVARLEISGGEERYVAIGFAGSRALVVVFTGRSESSRIISARKATPAERRRYGTYISS